MVAATRHLIHVTDKMRDEWYDFWQRAQEIYRAICADADTAKRCEQVWALIDETSQYGMSELDFRQRHHRLEKTSGSAIKVDTAS
ncbi:hypothetical protein CK231_10710 [Mesorhizobium loti]|uniref:hypothetical protein n=1 Tax=Mesorhizobium TaxID=68287 RepID=UPI000BAFE24E|nr:MULTISPECIES: hypothetical protein [Mesorhizobium]PBB14184.1 hypothetical protein CK231_10710 [Mesorhizobium loti]PBC07340.1 hypothetical protein CK230_27095 [Mesorhizobium sp. WSM3859]